MQVICIQVICIQVTDKSTRVGTPDGGSHGLD
jgi:hypothetical protein